MTPSPLLVLFDAPENSEGEGGGVSYAHHRGEWIDMILLILDTVYMKQVNRVNSN